MAPLDHRAVIRLVHSICDRFSYYTMDDLASDLITSIWAKRKEFENERHLKNYVWVAIERHMMNQARAKRVTKMFSECLGQDQTESDWLDTVGARPPTQEDVISVKQLRKLTRGWPMIHKMIFSILAEGGSILEASQELGLPPWDAIRLLREARSFVETGSSLPDRRSAA